MKWCFVPLLQAPLSHSFTLIFVELQQRYMTLTIFFECFFGTPKQKYYLFITMTTKAIKEQIKEILPHAENLDNAVKYERFLRDKKHLTYTVDVSTMKKSLESIVQILEKMPYGYSSTSEAKKYCIKELLSSHVNGMHPFAYLLIKNFEDTGEKNIIINQDIKYDLKFKTSFLLRRVRNHIHIGKIIKLKHIVPLSVSNHKNKNQRNDISR